VSELNVNIASDTKELIIRNGHAKVLKEPNKINLEGDIRTVKAFLDKRKAQSGQFSQEFSQEFHVDTTGPQAGCCPGLQRVKTCRAVVIADKEKGTIQLQLDPENFYGALVTGTLEESSELDIFSVNKQQTFSREALIQLIRFNRIYFPDQTEHAALLVAFTKFSAKTYIELEKENDTRGNASGLFKKVVNSNVPLNFKLRMPIYKGQPKETFTVDICIETTAHGVLFYLESVDLKERLELRKDEIFIEQLEACTDFPIIYK
jgi:hypothetical protein